MEEMSEISEVSKNLSLNSKTNTPKFGHYYVEASDSDNFDVEVNSTPKTEVSKRSVIKGYEKGFGLAQKGGYKAIEAKVISRNNSDSIKEDLKKVNASKDSKVSYEENSAQDFFVLPAKVTKTDKRDSDKYTGFKALAKSQHRKAVTDRLSESSSEILMDGSLILHDNRE